MGFIQREENLVFLGPLGFRNTDLTISLAVTAAQKGRRVDYGTLAGLVAFLEKAKAAGKLARRLVMLTHPSLLVVDEIGYLPVSRSGEVLFFQLVSRLSDRASALLTQNKSFRDLGCGARRRGDGGGADRPSSASLSPGKPPGQQLSDARTRRSVPKTRCPGFTRRLGHEL